MHIFSIVLPMNNRLLLLVQTHQHAAELMGCLPHIRANYQWVWVVYSPAVLADPATVEKNFDQQIADLTCAMKECYAREDGAGGDQYKAKRDAAVLEKSAKVKEAYKTLTPDQQRTAEEKLFKSFFQAIQGVDGMSCAISRHADHFETSAHTELQNSLRAGMKPGYVPGNYVVAWPTSLPKGGTTAVPAHAELPVSVHPMDPPKGVAAIVVPPAPPAVADTSTAAPAIKIDKRTKEYKARMKELQLMSLDDLGPIAFELGIKPTDPVAGKREALIEKIIELESTSDVNKY